MNKRIFTLLLTHSLTALTGFALGIYLLPILTAPPAPTAGEIRAISTAPLFTGSFSRDRIDSDALHWGEGTFYINRDSIGMLGAISPGPDFRLYLSPEFVETEARFLQLKPDMVQVGDVKTFENFMLTIPDGIDPANYNTAIVWCESFRMFITSGSYQ